MAKMKKRTHDDRIRMLENSLLNMHDNVIPATMAAIAERDSVIHACVLALHKLDPSRKLMKINAGANGHFYLFATEEEADAAAAPAPEPAEGVAAVDAEDKPDDTAKAG